MPATQENYSSKPFLSIINGKLRQKVDEGTPNAVYREGKTPKGDVFSKWELVYPGWSGVVMDIRVFENDFGETCNIEFEDAIISFGTERTFFSDFIKKFASADPKKEIVVSPYDFVTDEGKRKSGITLVQDGKKLADYFTKWDGRTPTYLHGYPQPEPGMDKDGWKVYFIEVKRFCKKWIEEHPINNIAAGKIEEPTESESEPGTGVLDRDDDKSEIKIESIPF